LRKLIEGLSVPELLSIDLRLSANCAVTTYRCDDRGHLKLLQAYFRPQELIELK
jgi:hypothetical protein